VSSHFSHRVTTSFKKHPPWNKTFSKPYPTQEVFSLGFPWLYKLDESLTFLGYNSGRVFKGSWLCGEYFGLYEWLITPEEAALQLRDGTYAETVKDVDGNPNERDVVVTVLKK